MNTLFCAHVVGDIEEGHRLVGEHIRHHGWLVGGSENVLNNGLQLDTYSCFKICMEVRVVRRYY